MLAERGLWLVELGHTRLKRAPLASGGRPGPVVAQSIEDFLGWAEGQRGSRVLFAGVPQAEILDGMTARLARAEVECTRVTLDRPPLPIAPAYTTLGVDRWLAFNAAWTAHRRALCVIDVGTATTLDLVDADGVHRGGWILPGPEAARSGLLARAPGLDRPREVPAALAPALDTAQALERGLVLQQAGAIRLGLAEAEVTLGERPLAVLTGGAAGTVQSAVDFDDLQPDLVLQGLALAASLFRS